jgi:hypothetical protein
VGQTEATEHIELKNTPCINKKTYLSTPGKREALSIFVPKDSPQNTHLYSYWSPWGKTSRSLVLTGTALLQRGQ